MKLARWLLLGLVAALCLGGWTYRELLSARLQDIRGVTPAPTGLTATSLPVETSPVTLGSVTDEVEAVGTLAPNETVIVAPEIAGRITALPFTEGQEVKSGDILVELDAAILEGELKQAEAELVLAEDVFERTSELAKRGSGTIVAQQQAISQRVASRVRVELARTRLQKTKLAAPFDGVVGLRSISAGNFVNVGQPIVAVTSVDPIKVDFRLPELFLSGLRDGQKVDVRVDAFPGKRFAGEIYAIDPVVDQNGRAVRLRARVPNKDKALAPGLFARVTVTTGARADARLIPEAALVPQPTGASVFVVKDGVARSRAITVGKRLPGQIEIVSGLEPGESVVTAGQMRLRDGAAVTLQPRQAERAQ